MALSKLDQLYKQVILDHSSHPHHYGTLDHSVQEIELNNPTCGDVIKLQLQIKDGIIENAAFTGHGCSISTASASMMCDAIIGKSEKEAEQLLNQFLQLVQGVDIEVDDSLAELEVLSGVSKFPARIKCATLAWKALEQSIESKQEVIETYHLHQHKEDSCDE